MNFMTEQMAKIVTAMETTAWGGLHGCLALVLDGIKYRQVIADSQLDTALQDKLASGTSTVTDGTPPT